MTLTEAGQVGLSHDDVRTREPALARHRTDAGSVEMVLHRPDARIPGVGLGLRVLSGGSRHLSPVVEDLSHVDDAAGLLGHTEHQVVVLRTVETGSETAHLLDQRAPDHREVGGVHVVAQSLGRPVRLVVRRVRATVDGHQVLVAVEVVHVAVLVDRPRTRGQGVGGEHVVVVEECDELAPRQRQGVAGRSHDAAVVFAEVDADPGFLGCQLLKAVADCGVGGPVVDQDPFPVDVLLADHGRRGVRERVQRRVIDSGDQREPRWRCRLFHVEHRRNTQPRQSSNGPGGTVIRRVASVAVLPM